MAPLERELSGTVTARIYKIAPEALWREAVEQGQFTGSPIDVKDGFIHFSTAAQVRETAARHFTGATDLVLIAIDPAGLDCRWEPSRGGELFPHLYDALPLRAVLWVKPVPLSTSGRHLFPDLE